MKCTRIILATAVLLVTGCVYEYPLTTEHNIPIDPELLGLWEGIPDEGDEPDPPEDGEKADEEKENPEDRMLILKFSDTEYMIHIPPGGNAEMYYRGYPINIGNVSCVQLQVIGDYLGPLYKEVKDLFLVATFVLENGGLEIKMLNPDLVGEDLESSEALGEAFLENKENKNLFMDPGKFRRVEN